MIGLERQLVSLNLKILLSGRTGDHLQPDSLFYSPSSPDLSPLDYAVNHKVKGDIKRQNLTNKADAMAAIEVWMNDPVNQEFIRDSILGKADENGDRKPWIQISCTYI